MTMLASVPRRDQAIALHPGGVPIEAILRRLRGGTSAPTATSAPFSVIAAIGPERGWVDREVATFVERGFAVVDIGGPILRVEAAVAALLGQLLLLLRARE